MLIFSGLLSGTFMSLVLPAEKLVIAIPLPSAALGGGLSQWSSNQKEPEKKDE